MDLTLYSIQSLAAKRFPFNREHYPDIPDDPGKANHYAQKHLLTHLSKNIGEIAAAIEPKDHGRHDTEVGATIIRKLLVNTIRLADVSGVPLESIQASISNWAEGRER